MIKQAVRRISWMIAMAGLAVTADTAGAAGRIAEGQVIALRWCAACHVVSPDQKTAKADAPAFATIATGLETDADRAALELFLADPHPVMPNMNLARQEVADLVAYIAGLRADAN